jgi:drug/metabolite transporter (DMT)-like permease
MGEILAFSALFMFSSNIIVTKIASTRLNLAIGFLISVIVNVIFSGILCGFQLIFSHHHLQWNTYGFLTFLLSGFFSTFLGRFLFFESIVKLGPAKSSAIQVSNPLFSTLIAWIALGETLTFVDSIVAIPAILSGLYMLSYNPRKWVMTDDIAASSKGIEIKTKGKTSARERLKKFLRADIFVALMSSLSYAIGNVLRGSAIHHWNQPILGALLGALTGLLLHLITNPNSKQLWGELKSADVTGVFLYIASGLLTVAAQICVIASMWYIPVSIANLITLSTPILVTPFSLIFLKNQEGISIYTITGISLVLIGIFILVLS